MKISCTWTKIKNKYQGDTSHTSTINIDRENTSNSNSYHVDIHRKLTIDNTKIKLVQ